MVRERNVRAEQGMGGQRKEWVDSMSEWVDKPGFDTDYLAFIKQ